MNLMRLLICQVSLLLKIVIFETIMFIYMILEDLLLLLFIPYTIFSIVMLNFPFFEKNFEMLITFIFIFNLPTLVKL